MMNSRKVYLALGSNLGDRRENIIQAVKLLEEGFGSPCIRLSTIIETKSEGFDGPDFLNAAALWKTDLPAEEILSLCKGVERELGRTVEGIRMDAEGKRIYASRPMDVDILLIGDETIRTETLTVPHPRMKEREFVMVPLQEIFNGID